MAAEAECCARCRYFLPPAKNGVRMGDCRRYPPTVFSTGEDDVTYLYPGVSVGDWCGEFQAAICGGAPESSKL